MNRRRDIRATMAEKAVLATTSQRAVPVNIHHRFSMLVRADVIAHWFDDIVTGEDEEIKNEPQPECANLVRLYVNDFGEEFFQNSECRPSLRETASHTVSTATRLQFLFLPRGKHFCFAFGRKTGAQFRLSLLRQ